MSTAVASITQLCCILTAASAGLTYFVYLYVTLEKRIALKEFKPA